MSTLIQTKQTLKQNKTKNVSRIKEGQCITTKGPIHQDYITIRNIDSLNIKIYEAILTEKGEIIIVGDFNTLLSIRNVTAAVKINRKRKPEQHEAPSRPADSMEQPPPAEHGAARNSPGQTTRLKF